MSAESLTSRFRRLFVYTAVLAVAASAAAPRPAAARTARLVAEARGPSRAEDWRHLQGRTILEINLRGNIITRDETILRELFLQPGDPVDAALLARDLNFLLGLSLFATVNVSTEIRAEGVVLTYRFVERGEGRYGLIYPTGDYRDEKIQAGFVYRHRNLLGGRESFWIELGTGREDVAEIRLARPWLGHRPIEHKLEFFTTRKDSEDEFRFQRVALGFWISVNSWRPREHRFLVQAVWGERRFRLEQTEGIWQRRLEKIHSIVLGYSRDTRDSFLQPSRGGELQVTGTLHDPLFGSTVVLKRMTLSYRRYVSVSPGWVTAFGLSAANQWGSLFYRGVYSLGGMDSVRGYRSGTFSGWEDHDGPDGPRGRNVLNLHLELRHDILPRFAFNLPLLGVVDVQGAGVLFVDAGFLWSEGTPIWPTAVRRSAVGSGGGLRIYTPIGDVLRVEMGVGEAGAWRLHLGSGLRF